MKYLIVDAYGEVYQVAELDREVKAGVRRGELTVCRPAPNGGFEFLDDDGESWVFVGHWVPSEPEDNLGEPNASAAELKEKAGPPR